jgi:SAM-dependent methyltransferase
VLRVPREESRFGVFNGRLALFHRFQDTKEYWHSHWSEKTRDSMSRIGREGRLPEFGSLILKHSPRHLPILEAGCGPGQIVAALHARGYHVSGVDYEPEVVRYVNETMPYLDVKYGDVARLNYADQTIGSYISIGVVEHLPLGPEPVLSEARRVLHPDGVALISVPLLNTHRRALLRRLGRNGGCVPAEYGFYQYYYSPEEFSRQLAEAGFRVLEMQPYGAMTFLAREHYWFSRFWRSPLCRERVKAVIRPLGDNLPDALKYRYSHMVMAVCRPAP